MVDDIRWIVDGDERYYRTGLGDEQMGFVENFLESVPDNDLVVFMTHIPWVHSTEWADEAERDKWFSLLNSHPHTVSFAAHTHRHYHDFIGEELGWPGEDPHHLISMGAVCGAWWSGAPDEYGIPHSMMRDGTPNGYGYLDITGNEWKLRFKAARRPADFQMHISVPDEISLQEAENTPVYANVFNAWPDAKVEMKIGQNGEWREMVFTEEKDPVYEKMKEFENSLETTDWRQTGEANTTPRHLWKGTLPANLNLGAHTVYVRSEDEWSLYQGRRVIRIVK